MNLLALQMRLRVQTLPPLPDLKAWFIPDEKYLPDSISKLKEALCSSVTVLKDAGVRREDIQLLLDEFELLNETPFTAALRDGDLVVLRALPVYKQSEPLKVEAKEGVFSPQVVDSGLAKVSYR